MTTPKSGAVEVVTFGCRLNLAESQTIRELAAQGDEGDLVVVNTCAVTAESTRQARQAIRRMKRERPGARIVVTGCAAQIEPETFADMAEVAHVMGNAEKTRALSWSGFAQRINVVAHRRGGAARQCAGPRTRRDRGPHPGLSRRAERLRPQLHLLRHSRRAGAVALGRAIGEFLAQARKFVETGHKEIVLTGVDLTSWGGDLAGAPKLGALVRLLLREIPGLPRLRLSSVDCIEADAGLLAAFAEEERLAPYLHLSLQSGDDLILKRMKRRHSRAESVAFCEQLRRLRPDVALGADLIAGFPTEDEAAAGRSRALVEDCGLSFLHVFPFSARPGTPAARMPRVAPELVKARAALLRDAGEKALERHLQAQVGRRLRILTERGGRGRADDFTPVHTPEEPPGGIVHGVVTGLNGGALDVTIDLS